MRWLAFVLFLLGAVVFWLLARQTSTTVGLQALLGLSFGVVLQRARFCFFCNIREALEEKKTDGAIGLLVALIVGILLTHVILGAWTRDPFAGSLPPKAHIAPLGWHLALAGLVFGLGMSLSGSCISGHLYRLAEGSLASILALLSSFGGFYLGFLSWETIFLQSVSTAPVLWLPKFLGYPGSALIQVCILLLMLAWLVARGNARPGGARQLSKLKSARPGTIPDVFRVGWQKVFQQQWAGWLGGLLVALLGVIALLRTQPLGVTAEFSRWTRQLPGLPDRLTGLDQMRGCIADDSAQLFLGVLGENGIFVVGLVLGAFVVSLAGGHFELSKLRPAKAVAAVLGGLCLGWGAMIGLGCTIGTLLSGITASALSGWLFGFSMLIGMLILLPLRRRYWA